MSEQELLKQLIFPVYFICKNTEQWKDLINEPNPPPIEQLYSRLSNATDVWSVQTYIQLKRRGVDVHLVPHYIPGKICITPYDYLAIKDFPFNSYVVACQHDRARPEICEQRIVQNHLNLINSTDHFMPHWPQPNLQPRKNSRGTKIENLVYKGRPGYLAESFKSPEFLQKLQSLGINLSISPDDENTDYTEWIDYTQADIVLAVRNIPEYYLSIKPATKLINAWLAGCPALLGAEPAYQHLRKSELDYIEVRSPSEVIDALVHLRDNPRLYSAMVENGFRRAKDFTPDSIANLWRDLLASSVAEGYEQWLRQSAIQKLIGRPIQFVGRVIKHKRELREHSLKIRTGLSRLPEAEVG